MKRSRIYHSVLSVLILSMVITSAVSCNKLSKENYDSLVLVDNQNSSSSKESDSKNESGSETQNVQDSDKNTDADNSDTVKNDSDKNKNADSDGTSQENKNTSGSADGTSTDDNNTTGSADGTSTDDNNTSGLTDGSGNVPDGITGNNTDTTDNSSLTGTDADASGNATNQNTDGNSDLKNGIQNDDNENTENDKNPEQNINSEDIDSKGNISNDKSGNNNTVESDDIAGTGSSDGTDIKSGTGSSEDTDIKSGTGSSEDTDIKSGTESSDGTDNKSDNKNSSDSKDNKEIKDINNTKDNKDTKDNQDTKDTKDSKNTKKDVNEKIFDDTKTNRYKSQELKDYIQKPVTEMTDEEFAAIAPTVNMSFEELVGDNGIYNGYPKAFPKPDTYKLVVDLRYKIVMAFTRDEKGDYTVPHRFMICSPGADGSNTPTGTFSMKDYRVRFSIFRNTESYGQYWSLINGKIYFHSLLYTSLNASDYTESSYRNLGTNVSHGCVRLAVPDARWIWYNIAPETTCIIRYGSKDDEQMQEIKKRLVLAKLPSKRVKLEKGKIPNTDNWSIDEVPQEVPFKNGSQD